ncbi:MAG: cytochrome d ubiquinol oxidase subunit II, partial [Ectothiorhodospiraceae bacterium]
MEFDYQVLRLIWWGLMAALLVGFAVMDGFDLGIAAQLPLVARTDTERRVAINSIGPVWDGNQVWLITAGGASFAAFPLVYAAAFSGFYFAMLLVLVALILRPVGFDFRNKIADTRWRATWDGALFISGFVPSLVFGVAVGNLLVGVPFEYNDELRLFYHGGLLGLLNPFALLCGLTSLAMLTMHGAAYLGLKTDGNVRERARRILAWSALAVLVLFTLGGIWVAYGLDGYVITSAVDPSGPSDPLRKSVIQQAGAWVANYERYPWMIAAPLLGYAGTILALLFSVRRAEGATFIATAAAVLGIIATAGLSLFPFIMPSSLDPSASLTLWDSTSSRDTLFTMTIVTAIFLPLIAGYTSWVYRKLRGRVT